MRFRSTSSKRSNPNRVLDLGWVVRRPFVLPLNGLHCMVLDFPLPDGLPAMSVLGKTPLSNNPHAATAEGGLRFESALLLQWNTPYPLGIRDAVPAMSGFIEVCAGRTKRVSHSPARPPQP